MVARAELRAFAVMEVQRAYGRKPYTDTAEFYNSERRGESGNLRSRNSSRVCKKLMSEGAKWRIFIPPNLAHGEEGSSDGKIDPNEVLVYEVALLSIGKTAAEQRAERRRTAIQPREVSQ